MCYKNSSLCEPDSDSEEAVPSKDKNRIDIFKYPFYNWEIR